MLKHVTVIALAVALCAPALAASRARTADPLLSGSYVYSGSENCPASNGSRHQLSGRISFDPETGKTKLNAYVVTGDKPEILGIKSNSTYANADRVLTLGAQSYHITYGPVQNGIATYASFIGLVKDGDATCGYQGTLTLQ